MAAPTLSRSRLRELADLRPEHGRVLSVFLNLDPTEFASPAARTTAINSLVNRARAQIDELDGLDHDELIALREDVDRVRETLSRSELAQDGTRGVAVFACGAAGVLEVVRLAQPVESRVVIDESAFVEPLVAAGDDGRWLVLLCNRRSARIFAGAPKTLEETDQFEDDVHRQHDQGGWSQSRFQRGVEKEKFDHLKHAADEVFAAHKRDGFDNVLIGAPEEMVNELKGVLHPYLRERIRGHVHVDVENSKVDDVRRAAAEKADAYRAKRERALLDRLAEQVGREARGCAGLDAVRAALEQARVEILLVEDGRHAPETEEAMQRAIEQSAEVVLVRHHDDLEPHGGIAALLRY